MRRFIPDIIAENFQKNNYASSFKAFAMFIDISGFTAMTEDLMKNGAEGAEVLAKIINRVFDPVIETVYLSNGFISTFAGDAFTAIFPQDSQALDIVSCAINIREIFNSNSLQETRFGTFGISVKIGLSYGNIDWGIIGPETHKTFYFRGEAVNQSAFAEHQCRKMEIVCDVPFIKECDQKSLDLTPINDMHFKIFSCNRVFNKNNIQICDIGPDILRYFMPKQVLGMEAFGEFREISAVFISYEDVDNLNSLESEISKVIEQADIYGGFFEGIDFGDKGASSLVIFGVPHTYEDIIKRTTDFSLSVRNILKTGTRMGIHNGIAFAGIKGNKYRLCYGVMGGVVNLTARLMMKAEWGQILCSPSVFRNINEFYECSSIGFLELKGFKEKIKIFRLAGKREASKVKNIVTEFIGRKSETQNIIDVINPIFNGIFGGIIYIDGAAGIGKTRFILNIKGILEKKGCKFILLNCDQILRKPFNQFETFFKNYFQLHENDNTQVKAEKFDRVFNTLIEETSDLYIKKELERTRSIIASMAGLECEDSLYAQLGPRGIYENTISAVKNFFLAQCIKKPLIIVIDDIHWIDNDSTEALKALTHNVKECPFSIIAVCRFNDDGTRFQVFESKDLTVNRIELKAFDEEMLQRFLTANYFKKEIPERTEKYILEKSGGNPFFAEQIALTLIENNYLDDAFNLKDVYENIPSGINNIIMSRIDRLSAKMKEAIKAASVLGRTFALNLIQKMVFSLKITDSEEEFNSYLVEGTCQQIWDIISEFKYIFKHALIRDVAYEMQMKERLRVLHDLAGSLIEDLYGDLISEYYFELADHYHIAENKNKAVEYLKKAADQAGERYQNIRAIELYDRLLPYLEADKDYLKVIEVIHKKGSILELTGRWDEAETLFERALELSEKIKNDNLLVDSMHLYGWLNLCKGNPEKAKEIMQKALDLSIKNQYLKGIGLSKGHMGVINFDEGQFDIALKYFQDMLEIFLELDDKKWQSHAYGNMGLVYSRLSDYNKAADLYKKQIEICEKIGDRLGISKATCNTGNIFYLLGDYETALKYYDEQLTICEELGDKSGISLALGNMGIIYASRGLYEKAMNYFERQLSISIELGDKSSISHAYGNMGLVLKDQGIFDKALSFYQKQLEMFRELGDNTGISYSLSDMGGLYFNSGDIDKASSYLDKAILISREINFHYLLCEQLMHKSEILLLQCKTEEALNMLEESMHIAQKLNRDEIVFNGNILKCRIRKDPQSLLQMLAKYNDDEEKHGKILHALWLITGDLYYCKKAKSVYEKLFQSIPLFEYKNMIKELSKH